MTMDPVILVVLLLKKKNYFFCFVASIQILQVGMVSWPAQFAYSTWTIYLHLALLFHSPIINLFAYQPLYLISILFYFICVLNIYLCHFQTKLMYPNTNFWFGGSDLCNLIIVVTFRCSTLLGNPLDDNNRRCDCQILQA